MKLSISRKVALLLTACLLVIFSGLTWFNLVIQRRAVMRILRTSGVQVAGLVAGATRDGMLRNNRELIQTTIDTLARIPSVRRIRIIRKGGEIAFSTDHAEIGRRLDPQTGPCVGCHGRARPPTVLPPGEEAYVYATDGEHYLGITQVIRNRPDCSTAACHVHPASERLLGTLYVDLGLQPFQAILMESATQMIVAGLLGILLIVTLLFTATHKMVRRPVQKLIVEAQRIAAGDLSARVPESSGDELGALARQFNIMARDLETARAELLEWGATLEQKTREKTEELRRAQEQILQVEKMASLGKLAAVVAHEINNPLASVVTYARLIIRRLKQHEELSEECRENMQYLETIAGEAERCGEIVAQLLSFARRRGGEFAPLDVNPVVEKALFLVHHKLEMNGVEAVKLLADDLPPVVADENQVLQALMALLINAAQAIEDGGGQVILTTRRASGGVEIEVADTGPGMTPEVAAHAFEPFFTTKPQGEGVGLGLSLVYGIVERHGGRIDLDTAPGRGCRFTLFFPEEGPGTDAREETP